MSLILDALNRADRERKNSQPTPDINTVHEVSYRPGGARVPTLWIVGGVLLVALVILLAYLLLQARQPSTPTASPAATTEEALVQPPTPQAAALTPSTPVVPADPAPDNTPAESPAKPTEAVHSLYAEADAPAVDEKINDLYKPVEEPPVVESVPVQVPAVTSVSLLDNPSTTETPPAPRPAAGAGKRYDAIDNVPDLRQLPWSVQQEIPSIIYSQHNFTGDGSSNVVLNGQPRRAGNQVGGQLNLEEIYVDGVLLRFREHRFKLRALNNWVNM